MFTLQGIKLLCWIYGVVCVLIKQPTVCILTAVRRLLWQELTFGKSQRVGLLLTGLSVNIKMHRFAWLYSNIVFPWSTVVEKLMFRLLVKKLCILWNSNFYCWVHNSLLLIAILSRANPVHALAASLFKICLLLSCHLCSGFPSVSFRSVSHTRTLNAFLFSPKCAMCPIRLILIGLISCLLNQECKSCCFLFYSCPRSSVAASYVQISSL